MEPNINQTAPAGQNNGPVVGIIIVIVVLLVGAFYFLGNLRGSMLPADETATTTEDGTVATTSDATDVDTLEADLNAESFDDIDAELNTY